MGQSVSEAGVRVAGWGLRGREAGQGSKYPIIPPPPTSASHWSNHLEPGGQGDNGGTQSRAEKGGGGSQGTLSGELCTREEWQIWNEKTQVSV